MYCLWTTLAKEDDNFVIKTTKPLPNWKDMPVKEQIQFIRDRIIGITNQELAQVNYVFAKETAYDSVSLLINQFSPCF